MKNCMFNCVSDDLELPDHWESKCRGNPEVINPSKNRHEGM